MERFTLIVEFHAENREDGMSQAARALDAFDDGFSEARLLSEEIPDSQLIMQNDGRGMWEVAKDRVRLVLHLNG